MNVYVLKNINSYKGDNPLKKMEFSVLDAESVSFEQLEEVIASTPLDENSKEVLNALIEGGFNYGAIVRGLQNGDAPSSGRMHREDYEKMVKSIIPEKGLTTEQQGLAVKISYYCYSEGHRLNDNHPGCRNRLAELLIAA